MSGQQNAVTEVSRTQLEEEGEIAADYLEEFLDIVDLDGDIDIDVDRGRAVVAVVTEEAGALENLIGRDGQVLDALQDLTRLAVQARTGERSRLMLDIAGHRAQRRAELLELAATTASEVKERGVAIALEPMNAFERKIIHDAVTEAGLLSESFGAEPERYVKVSLPAAE